MLSTFYVPVGHLYVFFGKMSIQVLCPFYIFNKFIYLSIYLFMAALGLRCWVFVAVRAFSTCGERGLLFVVVSGLLIAVASLVAELRL